MNFSIKKLKKFGFFSGNDFILSEEEVNILVAKIDGMYKDKLNEKLLDYSSNAPVLQNLYGRDKIVDSYLNKIVNNDQFKNTFETILGKNYKIWEISTRYSMGYDKGLEMHSDGKGQMNFIMYLNDQMNSEGVTAIWPRSHLLNRLSNFTSWRNMSFIWRFFTKPLNGKKGNYFFFINKTWHGRLPKKNNKITKALFFGCYSEGSSYNPISGSELNYKNLENSELKKRISFEDGKFNKNTGEFIISYKSHSQENKTFAYKIERFSFINFLKNIDQLILLLLLEVILFIPYRVYRLRKFKF